ncbi:hypothetical protein [Marilutibacter aestuarii]|uniref:Uncharacterized protein n=1 Tax=Marilutibacter aestuarii TaxID=1706195 RepID=A0A508A2M5_9GAMM|nr:hypothetical protein [Lysobacter aestuarii]TQD41175.1 hypothetical protein FKV25_13245 [Lysobacter aestuarii]
MSNLAEATTKVVEVLTSFTTEERLRIVKASLTLLGDDFSPQSNASRDQARFEANADGEDHGSSEVHPQAQQWMRKNGITLEQLEHCFHFDQGKVLPIALPGNASSKREQTANAYLATGLARYLASGDASFTDSDARTFCEQSGCYDSPNHTKSVKALKNKLTGSKSAGWKLTAPGLTAVAELVKHPKG